MSMRTIATLLEAPPAHWVGDGFLVRPLFGEAAFTAIPSPFLMLDWAAPTAFPPSSKPHGVGPHPHRGFETVTIVYDGEVEHRDSAGYAGRIGPGDVQWMTAGSGVLHEEMHGRDFAARGGRVSMAQLWVNLPAADKMTAPRYQPIVADQIPTVALDGCRLRVIAGSFDDRDGITHIGPAQTFSPLSVWDGRFEAGGVLETTLAADWTVLVVVLEGGFDIAGRPVAAGRTAILNRDATTLRLEASGEGARFLVLAGRPIDEPIAHMGPFVMNTREELVRAVDDFRSGRMGRL